MTNWEETTKAMKGLGQAAKESGQHFEHAHESVVSLGNALKLGVGWAIYQKGSEILKGIAITSKQQLATEMKTLEERKEALHTLKTEIDDVKQSLLWTKEEHDLKHETYALGIASLIQQEKYLSVGKVFYTLYSDYWRKNWLLVAVTGTWLKLTKEGNRDIHLLNESLAQTNASFSERYRLVAKINLVQRDLGASAQTMADASAALVDYGMELESSFGANLKLVTMMKEGLNVSASTGANLVTVFERGLKQSAKDVADLVARIASQTGLAAQKAAQYAVELARGLRLLGPMRVDATGVARVVEGLAARVEEMGGNSEVVVRMYKQMLGGTAESFMLRGRAGVGVGAMGTESGAQSALEGLARSMQSVVRAAPGTNMYVAQLQAAAELHGMAAEDVRDYLEAIKMSARPLTEVQALQKAYNNQTQMVGKAWQQMRESLMSLYTRAMIPFLNFFAPFVRGLSQAVKWVADTKAALFVAMLGVTSGAVAAGWAMVGLSKAMWKFAVQANLDAIWPGLGKLGSVLRGLGGAAKAGTTLSTFGGFGTSLGGGAARAGLGRFAALGIGGPLGAILGAGLAGAAVGTIINQMMPQSWRDTVGNLLSKIAGNTGLAVKLAQPSSYGVSKQVKVYDTIERLARVLAQKVVAGTATTEGTTALMKAFASQTRVDLTSSGAAASFQAEVARRVSEKVRKAAYGEQLKGITEFGPERVRAEKLNTDLEQLDALMRGVDINKQVRDTSQKLLRLKQEQEIARKEDEQATAWYWLMHPFGGPSDDFAVRRRLNGSYGFGNY